MKQPIVNQMFEKAKADNIKITDLAKALNIPQNRIYQWKSSGVAPKAEDAKKIESWLKGESAEEVQKEEIDLGAAVKEMRAVTSAILAVSAEILAKVSDRSAAAVRAEVDTMVKNILNASEPG